MTPRIAAINSKPVVGQTSWSSISRRTMSRSPLIAAVDSAAVAGPKTVQRVRGEACLQRLKMQEAVAADGEPADGAEMMIGIDMQLGDGATTGDVREVALFRF